MLQKIADTVKVLSAETVSRAGSGHPGMPLGCAELGAYLFAKVMKYNSAEPAWFNRDRLILSAGHGAVWLYSLLNLAGYNLTINDLKNYRKFKSKTPAHPELGITPGVEMTTGPLGQGLGHAVGIAIAETMLAAHYNQPEFPLLDHYTYAVVSDGDLMEGLSYEAASLAGSLGLGKLIVVYDQNGISIDGKTNLTFPDQIKQRFDSQNWQVIDQVQGNSFIDLAAAFKAAKTDFSRPTLIAAQTVIGAGVAGKEGTSAAHGAPFTDSEIKELKIKLGFSETAEFVVPQSVRSYFVDRKAELMSEFENWQYLFEKYQAKFPELAAELAAGVELKTEIDFSAAGLDFKKQKPLRNYSGEYYRYLGEQLPYLIGGTADLTASTRLNFDRYPELKNGYYKGRNIKFGIREHAMAAAAGGIMLHGGLRPVVATYLTFSDYMRPAIRLAALMKLPVIYLFTHDSIFVGEDGPTHQPIEQLESLRLIPNLRVIRPASGAEVKLAWQTALKEKDQPVALVIARQAVDLLPADPTLADFDQGAYLVTEFKQAAGKKLVSILASGSEVATAVAAAQELAKSCNCRVISVPEKEKLYSAPAFLAELLADSDLEVAVEAGSPTGWYRLLTGKRLVIGIEEFGYSAAGAEIADYFGLTAQKIAAEIKKII